MRIGAAKQGQAVGLPKVAARHQRHGHTLVDLLGGLGGADESQVQRKGHDGHANQQDDMPQDLKAGASFDHD